MTRLHKTHRQKFKTLKLNWIFKQSICLKEPVLHCNSVSNQSFRYLWMTKTQNKMTNIEHKCILWQVSVKMLCKIITALWNLVCNLSQKTNKFGSDITGLAKYILFLSGTSNQPPHICDKPNSTFDLWRLSWQLAHLSKLRVNLTGVFVCICVQSSVVVLLFFRFFFFPTENSEVDFIFY